MPAKGLVNSVPRSHFQFTVSDRFRLFGGWHVINVGLQGF